MVLCMRRCGESASSVVFCRFLVAPRSSSASASCELEESERDRLRSHGSRKHCAGLYRCTESQCSIILSKWGQGSVSRSGSTGAPLARDGQYPSAFRRTVPIDHTSTEKEWRSVRNSGAMYPTVPSSESATRAGTASWHPPKSQSLMRSGFTL